MRKKTKKKLTLIVDLAIWFSFLAICLYFIINYIGAVWNLDDDGMFLYGLSFLVYVATIFLVVLIWAMISMALKDYKEKEDEKK